MYFFRGVAPSGVAAPQLALLLLVGIYYEHVTYLNKGAGPASHCDRPIWSAVVVLC